MLKLKQFSIMKLQKLHNKQIYVIQDTHTHTLTHTGAGACSCTRTRTPYIISISFGSSSLLVRVASMRVLHWSTFQFLYSALPTFLAG